MLELLQSHPELVTTVILSEKAAEQEYAMKIENLCGTHKIHLYFSDKTLNRISVKENCFAAAVFTKPECELDNHEDHVVLVNPSDMGNIGTIIRTAVGFSVHDIAVIAPACDYYDPKSVRASMGAIFKARIRKFSCFDEYQSLHAERFYFPFMLKACENLETLSKTKKPRSLIFGNEGAGLDDCFLRVGTPVRIEHSGLIDSLNLTIAVGIGLYELRK